MSTKNSLSIVHGLDLESEEYLGSLSIPGYLRDVTSSYSGREALVMHSAAGVERWTYIDLWNKSFEVAKALGACGIGKNTRVGILMTNRPEFLSAFFGIAMAGGVPVVLSTFSVSSELRQLLALSELSILLFEGRILKTDFAKVILELDPALQKLPNGELVSKEFPYLRRLVSVAGEGPRSEALPPPGIESWQDFLKLGATIPNEVIDSRINGVVPTDPGGIFFSSGTTSLPKGILHTQRAFAIQWWRYPRLMGIDGPLRSWTGNGFFWSANITMNVAAALTTGGTIVLQPYFDPQAALQLVEEEKISILMGRPHQWARMHEAPNWDSADLSSLRYVTRGEKIWEHPTVNTRWLMPMGYGCTETMSISTSIVFNSKSALDAASFGTPCPGNILKIVDPATGEVVPKGARGEVCLKGPTLMQGYVGKPPEACFDSEGFFCTGDGGYIGPNDDLIFEGRLTEIIKTGGANVSPDEIDEAISQYPGVRRTKTVGIPDDMLGERIVSCIVPQEGVSLDEQKLRTFLKERLASFKLPKNVLLVNEQDIAVTGSGKVKVVELRQFVTKRLQSNDVSIS